MDFDKEQSMYSPDFTWSYSKLSCLKAMFPVHLTFAYLIFITGLMCMITRVIPFLKWTHIWFGRAYILTMLWGTATSMLINNTGLPTGVLVSFLICMTGLSLGWVAINFHQSGMERKAISNVQETMKITGVPVEDLSRELQKEKARIADSKSWFQRVFSLKALHGSLFVVSWFNIAGRVFSTPISSMRRTMCYTYPYYKPFYTGNTTLEPVPLYNPIEDELPWAKTGDALWGIIMSFGLMAGCFLVGAVYSFIGARSRSASAARHAAVDDADADAT